LPGELGADAVGGGDLRDGGAAEAGDAAEVLQEDLLPVLGDAGAIVEKALGDAAFHQELVVAVGKAVGFVANALEHFQGAAGVREEERKRVAGAVDFLKFFGEADDRQFVQAEALQLAASGGELAFATIDDDEIGEG